MCVLVETAKFEAFKQRSGLHIEVPSVYNWQLHVAAHWADKQTAASLGGRQNPVKRELDVAINFVSSTKNMLHLSFYLVKAIHKRY